MEPYGLPAGTAINYKALGFPAWVDQLCTRWGLDSSTYPNHQSGDRPDIGAAPNPDGENRGIDWAGDPQHMLDFARWLVSIGPDRTPGQYGPPGLEMVIYQDPRDGTRVWYPSWVNYDSDFGGHTDHVHTRQSAALIDAAKPAVMTVPLVARPNGRWGSPSPAWDHLIERESGGDPDIVQQIIDVNSGGNEAEGLFQITPATWRAHGGDEFAPTPRHATPAQQAIVAARIITANPSGSDWGAGLPGREDAGQLVAGLVPADQPAPSEEDPMSNPELERMIREIHGCLFNQITSQSSYRALEGETNRWKLHELIRNDDGMLHQLYVETQARDGDPQALTLLITIAGADPTKYPDRQEDAARAARFLASLHGPPPRPPGPTPTPGPAETPTPDPGPPPGPEPAPTPTPAPSPAANGGLAEHLAHAAADAAAAALAEAQPHLEQAEVEAVRARIKEVLGT